MILSVAMLAFQVVPAGAVFECTPIAVWDGDGPIWCAEGPRVRLAGVAAREIDNSCRPGHPCPATPGLEARDHLVRLLGGPRGRMTTGHIRVQAGMMSCTSDGSAGGNRTAAWCTLADGSDLNCRMVQSVAARWPRYWRDHQCR